MKTDIESNIVLVNVEGRVATIQLNRPESLNSLNLELIKALTAKLKEISITDDIDIVVLTGNERAFSSGGDIKMMLEETNESDFYHVMDSINELIMTLYSLPKLSISAISGSAAGLGFSIALATDYILADQNSKLAMNFIGIGLVPDGGAHFFLEKKMGEDQAKQLIWEGKVMSANEAWQKGLIHEVAVDYKDALNQKLEEYLKKPVQAMVKTKKIMVEKNRPQLLKILELEKYGQYKMRQTEDHQEGIRAFIEKRKPQFKGK